VKRLKSVLYIFIIIGIVVCFFFFWPPVSGEQKETVFKNTDEEQFKRMIDDAYRDNDPHRTYNIMNYAKKAYPDDAGIMFKYGYCSSVFQDYKEAVPSLKKAYELVEEDDYLLRMRILNSLFEAFYELQLLNGTFRHSMDYHEEMEATLEKMEATLQEVNFEDIQDPTPEERYYFKREYPNKLGLMGYLYFEKEDYKAAIDYHKKSIDQGLKICTNYRYIGGCYYYLEEYKKAKPYLLKAHELDPDNLNTMILLAGVYGKLEQLEVALEYCKKTLEKAEEKEIYEYNYYQAYTFKVTAYEELGEYQKAYDALQVLLNADIQLCDGIYESKEYLEEQLSKEEDTSIER